MGAFSDALEAGSIDSAPDLPKVSIAPGRPRVYISPQDSSKKETVSPFKAALDNRDVRPDIPETPKSEDAPALFTKRFEAVGPVQTTTALQRMDINQGNELTAVGQRTSPHTEAHDKNYISSDVYENDAGHLLYQDLDTGKLIPTDANKHVVLRDPNDNRLKVYARSSETDEGPASGAGRLLRIGTMASAPTAAAGEAAAAAPLLTAAKSAPKAIAPGQEVADAAQRIGVDVPRAVTSDNMGTQWAGKIATNIPFAGTPLRKASETAVNQLGEAGTAVEQGFGGGSVPAAGASIRSGIENYIGNTTKARQGVLYNKVDALVDNAKTTKLAETERVAGDIIGRRENAAITEPSNAVKRIQEAVSRPGLNYEGVKTLRTYIGEMMQGKSPMPADMSEAELKLIYGGLSKDLRVAARNGGGDKAVEAFDRANTYTRLVSERRENLMRILGAKSDEGVFDKIAATAGSTSRADITLLRQARKSVEPEAWNELASGVISRLGRPPGTVVPGSTGGDFSPDRFVTAFNKLTPEAKTLLFRSTGRKDLADSLEDIAKVSSRFKELNKYANPSGTGHTVAGFAELQGLWHAPLSTLGAIISGRIVSHILSVPQTAQATAKWSKAYELAVTKPTTMTIESFRQASKVLATNIGREAGRPDLVPELARQLQNSAQARADNNKKP